MAKRIGVILSGCGVMDGSEIYETVAALLAIDNAGAEAVCMAPDTPMAHVINHMTGEPMEGESRNVLIEAARLARGKISNLADCNVDDLDAIVIPGGFGAAKNLGTYAFDGPDMSINPDVQRVIQETHAAKKPICAVCISPVILTAILKDSTPSVTIGMDQGTAAHIAELGGTHVNCPVKEFVVDKENKIVTTPAYMLGKSIGEVAIGIDKAVKATIELI